MRAGFLGALLAVAGVSLTAPGAPARHAWSCERAIQAVIDHGPLQQYFHAEVSGRVPLVVLRSGLTEGIDLEKFGQPVRVLSLDEIAREGSRAYVEFDEMSFRPDSARVSLRYAVEGIHVTADLGVQGSEWRVTSFRLVER